ncbi:Uncharacterised protein [Mycobacteroides abscessus subsp. massiliense]|nr:Uncharacterised protein [Mycobacteroides abscessus subsp. massiliense]
MGVWTYRVMRVNRRYIEIPDTTITALAADTAGCRSAVRSTIGRGARFSVVTQAVSTNSPAANTSAALAGAVRHSAMSLIVRSTVIRPTESSTAPSQSVGLLSGEVRGRSRGMAMAAVMAAAPATTRPMRYAARTPPIWVRRPATG